MGGADPENQPGAGGRRQREERLLGEGERVPARV